jgi:hypothetical protein
MVLLKHWQVATKGMKKGELLSNCGKKMAIALLALKMQKLRNSASKSIRVIKK